jgi:hypothetical protein
MSIILLVCIVGVIVGLLFVTFRRRFTSPTPEAKEDIKTPKKSANTHALWRLETNEKAPLELIAGEKKVLCLVHKTPSIVSPGSPFGLNSSSESMSPEKTLMSPINLLATELFSVRIEELEILRRSTPSQLIGYKFRRPRWDGDFIKIDLEVEGFVAGIYNLTVMTKPDHLPIVDGQVKASVKPGRIDATNCTLRGITPNITIERGKTTSFTILAKDKFGNVVKSSQIQSYDSEEDDSLYSGVLYDEKELAEKKKMKSAMKRVAQLEQQLFGVSIIEGPTKANITVNYNNNDVGVKLQDEDYCLVKFKPLQTGHYVLRITYDKQELFESPLHIFVEHGLPTRSNTTVEGPGLQMSIEEDPQAGGIYRYYVTPRDAFNMPTSKMVSTDNFKALIVDPEGNYINPALTYNRTNNRFAFQFKPKKSGSHKLFVAILIDTDETALKEDIDDVSFAEIRSSSRVFELDSDSEEEIVHEDEVAQNVFETWYPKKQNVKSSPFEFTVLPGELYPKHTIAYGLGLSQGVVSATMQRTFEIQAKDYYNNKLTYGGAELVVRIEDPSKEKVPANLKDNGNGTYTVAYYATKSGTYKVYVTYNSTNINGSPFVCKISAENDTDPAHSEIKLKATKSPVKHLPAHLAHHHESHPDDIVVIAGDEIVLSVQSCDKFGNRMVSGGDEYSLSCHRIEIQQAPASPVLIAEQPKKRKVDEFELNDRSNMFRNQSPVQRSLNPTRAAVPNPQYEVIDHYNGAYSIKFKENIAGFYVVSIKQRGVEIKGSPFNIRILPGTVYSRECTAAGEGLDEPQVGKEKSFVITLRDKFGNSTALDAEKSVPLVKFTNDNVFNPHTTYLGHGKYNVKYTPLSVDAVRLAIFIHNSLIKDFPRSINVKPGVTNALMSAINLTKLVQNLKCGEWVTIGFKAKDEFGNDKTTGGDAFVAVSEPPRGLDLHVMDYKNGTYELKMCPRVAYQNFSVHIKLGDQDIHGSPFTVTSEPGITTDVQIVKIENNRVGERCTFEFVAKDTIGNEKKNGGDNIILMLKGVNVHSKIFNPSVPISTKDLQNGHYLGSFTSTLAGNYSVGVYKVQTTVNPEPVFLKSVDVPLFAGEIEPLESIVIKDEQNWKSEMQIDGRESSFKKEVFIVCKDKWKNSARVKDEEHLKSLKVKAEIWRALDPSPYSANSNNNQVEYDVYGECVLSAHKSGIISTKFDIADIGSYQLRVEFNGRSINQPPLSFKITSGPIDPISCVVKGRKILTGNEAKNGDLQIEARDRHGNRVTSGGAKFRVVIDSAESSFAPFDQNTMPTHIINDNQNGTYGIFYSLHKPGKYIIEITCNNVPLKGSPFEISVSPEFSNLDSKRKWMEKQLQDANRDIVGQNNLAGPIFFAPGDGGYLSLQVQRDRVFQDSFDRLQLRQAKEWKKEFKIQFVGEPGVDAGGLLKEWATIMSKKMFDRDYALFTHPSEKAVDFQPNPLSSLFPEHLAMFEFVGKFIAKLIFDNTLRKKAIFIPVHFTKFFYSLILGRKDETNISLEDMKAVDEDYYRNLVYVLNNDATDLEMTFTMSIDQFEQKKEIELVPGGKDKVVNNFNKRQFVELCCQWKLYKLIEKQVQAFLKGFYAIVPKEMIFVYSEEELEQLLCGRPDISIQELRESAQYKGGWSKDDEQIKWLWAFLESLSKEDKVNFVKFVFGFEKTPLDGFKSLNPGFSIIKTEGQDSLPKSSTCFNQFKLPLYSSPKVLQEKITKAIREANEGFGFA